MCCRCCWKIKRKYELRRNDFFILKTSVWFGAIDMLFALHAAYEIFTEIAESCVSMPRNFPGSLIASGPCCHLFLKFGPKNEKYFFLWISLKLCLFIHIYIVFVVFVLSLRLDPRVFVAFFHFELHQSGQPC